MNVLIECALFTGAGFIIYFLFFSCFLPIRTTFSKQKVFLYSIFLLILWICVEIIWIHFETQISYGQYGYAFVGINILRTIMMITSVSLIFAGEISKKIILIFLNYIFLSISEAVYMGLYGTIEGFESLVPTIFGSYPWIGSDLINFTIIALIKLNRRKGLFLNSKLLLLQTLLLSLSIIVKRN